MSTAVRKYVGNKISKAKYDAGVYRGRRRNIMLQLKETPSDKELVFMLDKCNKKLKSLEKQYARWVKVHRFFQI